MAIHQLPFQIQGAFGPVIPGTDEVEGLDAVLANKLEAAGVLLRKAGAATSDDTALFVWDTRDAEAGGKRLYAMESDGSYSVVPVGAGSGGEVTTAQLNAAVAAQNTARAALATRSDDGDKPQAEQVSTADQLRTILTGQQTSDQPFYAQMVADVDLTFNSVRYNLLEHWLVCFFPRLSGFDVIAALPAPARDGSVTTLPNANPSVSHGYITQAIFDVLDAIGRPEFSTQIADATGWDGAVTAQESNNHPRFLEIIQDFNVEVSGLVHPRRTGQVYYFQPRSNIPHLFEDLQHILAEIGYVRYYQPIDEYLSEPDKPDTFRVYKRTGESAFLNQEDIDEPLTIAIHEVNDLIASGNRSRVDGWRISVANDDGVGFQVGQGSYSYAAGNARFDFEIDTSEEQNARLQAAIGTTPGFVRFQFGFYDGNVGVGNFYYFNMPIDPGIQFQQGNDVDIPDGITLVPSPPVMYKNQDNDLSMDISWNSLPENATHIQIILFGATVGVRHAITDSARRLGTISLDEEDIPNTHTGIDNANVGFHNNGVGVQFYDAASGGNRVASYSTGLSIEASKSSGTPGATAEQAAAISANTARSTANATKLAGIESGATDGATAAQAAAIAANTSGRTANASAIAQNLGSINTERGRITGEITRAMAAETALGRRIDTETEIAIRYSNPATTTPTPGEILVWDGRVYIYGPKHLETRELLGSDFRRPGSNTWGGILTARPTSPPDNTIYYTFTGYGSVAARRFVVASGGGTSPLGTGHDPSVWAPYDSLEAATTATTAANRVIVTPEGGFFVTGIVDARWIQIEGPLQQTITPSTTAINVDVDDGAVIELEMNRNVALQLSGGDDGTTVLVRATQDATGSRTLSFHSSIQGKSAPTLTTTAGKSDYLHFHRQGARWKFISVVHDV